MITSRDNDTLKLTRKLLRQRSVRAESGLFAVEGEDLVDAAAAAGIEPVHLLVAGETVEPDLMATVSTLAHPARAIGVYHSADLPRAPRQVCLALWQIGDPGNVGTLIRTADAFGAAVALADGSADPFSSKATRASAGAIFRVPLVPWADHPGKRVGLDVRNGVPLSTLALEPPLTLILGAERTGLPDDVLATCGVRASIPMPGAAESLNVAAAGAIALYEVLGRRSFSSPSLPH